MEVNELLARTIGMGASDLHLKEGRPPTVRVDGQLEVLAVPAMSMEDVAAFAETVMPAWRREAFATKGEVDFAYDAAGVGRFRVNVYRQQGTIALAIRYILPKVPSLSELGIPPIAQRLADENDGLILVTGATGSGKTTTLAAMIDHINATRDAHIVTIEDPVEIRHEDNRCLI
ncbi:MAG: Flp pilus assembly complex ATPase component TadA, partial [Acidimicrobiia bacterium]|nr:Flp pilus assembly complex ATPase component TadA [Acidimicrobiia bacterium]